MTIEFNCPKCKAVIAFADQHAGKRAKCLTCKQRLIIPAGSGQAAARAAEEPVDRGRPLPGFYGAVLLDGWKLFFKTENLVGLSLVTAAVCLRFFAGHTDYSILTPGFNVLLPMGWIVTLAAWGIVFWYYLDVITTATFEGCELADMTMGDSVFEVLWSIIKGLWVFAFGLVLVQGPAMVWLGLQRWLGFESTMISSVLTNGGLFFFPMVILTFGVNRDVAMLARFDQMIRPVLKALRPYALASALLLAVWNLQMLTRDYGDLKDPTPIAASVHLASQLAVQALAILAMRAMGLFYKHHACYFAW